MKTILKNALLGLGALGFAIGNSASLQAREGPHHHPHESYALAESLPESESLCNLKAITIQKTLEVRAANYSFLHVIDWILLDSDLPLENKAGFLRGAYTAWHAVPLEENPGEFATRLFELCIQELEKEKGEAL